MYISLYTANNSMGSAGLLSSPFIAALLLLTLYQQQQTIFAKHNVQCSPSSCGNILNIRQPFRLEIDPKNCGVEMYSLSCNNNRTVLYLNSMKYYVLAINYSKHTIRLVDSNFDKDDCSSIPPYSLSTYNFSNLQYPYKTDTDDRNGRPVSLSKPITFLKCENPMNSPLYIPTAPCITSNSSMFLSSSDSERHSYVKVGSTESSELKESCQIELMVMTSWHGSKNRNISYTDIHNELVYGFELAWNPIITRFIKGTQWFSVCTLNDNDWTQCRYKYCGNLSGQGLRPSCGGWTLIRAYVEFYLFRWGLVRIVVPFIVVEHVRGILCLIALLIYKWRRRHLSQYEVIEEFLRTNNIIPIRYSYSDIRKMTKVFKDKLGEGGYGSVYKGKLRSGRLVAIKMLDKSKANNGQEFTNEVATIGRIHHVNVVQLVGFCVEGSKRGLVYDFMPNGSLDKYIFSREGSDSLDCKKMREISLGVACGIEYLHRGCNMQILHFDIKLHNILLDENFIPKVSDFGLARLCPLDNSIMSLTAAIGTMGYMAPELLYKNIGRVSYKADVYSFGMLLMEMASRRKNLNAVAEHKSQIYFPSWVYDRINVANDLQMEDATEQELKISKKMIIIALWCIQLKPSDRPSMNKVKEMLDGELDSLEMPPKPFLCPQDKPVDDERERSNSRCSTTALDDESNEITLILDEN